jgi:flagellar motor protein MotB
MTYYTGGPDPNAVLYYTEELRTAIAQRDKARIRDLLTEAKQRAGLTDADLRQIVQSIRSGVPPMTPPPTPSTYGSGYSNYSPYPVHVPAPMEPPGQMVPYDPRMVPVYDVPYTEPRRGGGILIPVILIFVSLLGASGFAVYMYYQHNSALSALNQQQAQQIAAERAAAQQEAARSRQLSDSLVQQAQTQAAQAEQQRVEAQRKLEELRNPANLQRELANVQKNQEQLANSQKAALAELEAEIQRHEKNRTGFNLVGLQITTDEEWFVWGRLLQERTTLVKANIDRLSTAHGRDPAELYSNLLAAVAANDAQIKQLADRQAAEIKALTEKGKDFRRYNFQVGLRRVN